MNPQEWTGIPILQLSHICLRNSLKITNRICQFSRYLGTKLGMLFKIANLVEIVIDRLFKIAKLVEKVIILGKIAILP